MKVKAAYLYSCMPAYQLPKILSSGKFALAREIFKIPESKRIGEMLNSFRYI
jgi:Mg2+/Co2+ transporter CorC